MWTRRLVAALCSICLVSGLMPAAQARIVGTGEFLELHERGRRIEQISATLAAEDVREQLVAMGVDPTAARERVRQLSHDELQFLEQHIDQLPAGGDALVVIGIIFIVLLVLELVGVTNIFTGL